MATIHDVAKLAGVSTATVSRSFTETSALSYETRGRVLEIAERLNYRPRGLASRTTRSRTVAAPNASVSTTIGFEYFAYVPSDTLPSNGFYSAVLDGAQAEAARLGMHMLLSTTHRHKPSQELPPMVREQAVAGMLLVGAADADILETFVQYVPHIVLLDNRDIRGRHDSVFSDGFGGAYEATKHLLDLGHRHIGFLTSRATELTFRDRLNGFVCAHFHAGVAINHDHIVAVGTPGDGENETLSGKELRERSMQEVVAFLKKPGRPTAFVCANDDHAALVLRACRALDISIPGAMSVIGYDDADTSAELEPPLSSVRVDMRAMGEAAVRRLHARIAAARQGEAAHPPVFEQLPTKLVVRQTTAAPPV
ncbi:LacI family transcriptional regulator [Capsulimonas corticalis]|uniref:LacI family transcriptional regulator n=1 Tax=Capsulimonas corticalis TaxID=2219043 RepID=A0A402D3X4_9BACT|nr:LacI family DNA-binding transcriptional regulator [Capsulimonas corticalis]BDI31211.1 LacI family transcriptional regulator [Capsulimonas corticalis]